MKTPSTTLVQLAFALPLIAGLGLALPARVAAQTFTTLHDFNFSDGSVPKAQLALSGNSIYGAARLQEVLQRLVQFYQETNRPDQAAEWKHKLADFDPAAK